MTVSIISRSAWGARAWNGTPNYVALSQRTEFFIHYDGANHITATGNSIPQAVDRQHQAQGWAGIGYSFVIDQAGNIYEGRGWTGQGAHCPGHNISGLGVQIAIGGDQEPSAKALSAARALYDEACRKAGRTLAKKGHKDGIATACPGGKLYAWVRAGMPADGYEGGGSTPPQPAPWDGKSYPGASAFVLGKSHPAVTVLGQRLVAHGYGRFYSVGPGPTFGQADKNATSAFQKAQGWSGSDADGYPGPSTWSRLMATPKAAASKPAAKRYEPFPGAAFFKGKPKSAIVTAMGKRLAAEGCGVYSSGPGPQWTESDRKSYAQWQRKLGYTGSAADGYPGKASWDKLRVPEV